MGHEERKFIETKLSKGIYNYHGGIAICFGGLTFKSTALV